MHPHPHPHCAFQSSHVGGDFADGRLMLRMAREDAAAGVTRVDEVFFTVPSDFHTHNDSVAAASLTLVGRSCPRVSFNFPISPQCAELLQAHYGLAEVGPVDPALTPRRPGRQLALNLSGGIDSTALWLLLRAALGHEFRTISSAYGGRLAFEEAAFRTLGPDTIVGTNLRALGLDQHGRFNAAAPLLFADYLDLHSLTSAHIFREHGYHFRPQAPGDQPYYLQQEAPYRAGGLREAHIVRSLYVHGLIRLILRLAPERMRAALLGCAPVGTEKFVTKALLVRAECRALGIAPPRDALDPRVTVGRFKFRTSHSEDLRALAIIKHDGWELASRLFDGLERFDLGFLDDVSLEFVRRYHPDFVALIPTELRAAVLELFERCDILPYDARDLAEFELVNTFLTTAPLRHELAPAASQRA
jgi:hypothetical protein